jgi:diphthamide biosynthesis protein 2
LNGFCLSVSGRICHIPGGRDVLGKGFVLFIGEEGLTLTNLMFNLNSLVFFTYDPKTMILRRETLNINQQLRKRYYLIEKAKDAKLIGILVATLGI